MKQYEKQQGFSTIELLIAFAVIILSISTVILVVFGNQSTAVDAQTNNEALSKAQAGLEYARAQAASDYSSVTTTLAVTDGIYQKQRIVDPLTLTQCSKDVKSSVTWTDEKRPQQVELTTHLSDIVTALALGGNCDSTPPAAGWNPPATWASSNFNPGKPTGLDALNRIVYMTGDKTPFLYIADVHSATLGQSGGLFVTFTNGFNDGAQLNDIKVARAANNKIYAYVARNTNTNQFEVIDVTDITQPVSIIKRSLSGVSSSGSFPQGFRVFYFDNRAYIVTRETTGPELHIFDASTPWNAGSIVELGSGKELNRTVESMVVTKKFIAGVWRYFAYMATDKDSAELSIFEVTTPSSITEFTSAEVNLSGNQDGASVFLINNKLYFGRNSTGGVNPADLYVFDASNLLSSSPLPILGSQDIGTDVIGISVSGPLAFLATTKANNEFQVYNSDPANLSLISPFNPPNVIANGIKYENNWVYLASAGNDSLRILYNNP